MLQRSLLASVWPPSVEAVRQAGHKPSLPLEAIRRKCLDCSCYQPSEVRSCEALECSLWPFRAGRYPVGTRAPEKPDPVPDFRREGAL